MVTSAEELLEPNSSANLAFEWLVGQDAYYICPDDSKVIQRYVVAKIYFQQEGDAWLECSNPSYSLDAEPTCDTPAYNAALAGDVWLDESHECDWAFITCNTDMCITKIEVDDNKVGGTLVNEIDYLPMLEVYTMDGDPNEIVGTIPTQFGNLTHLRILDLDENGLTGSTPEEIYVTAKGMEQFDLDSNLLTGTISTLIGTITDLVFVQLFNNTIGGTIPTEMANLKKLGELLQAK